MTPRGSASTVISMGRPSPVSYVCVGIDHLRQGLAVPDERGYLTVHDGRWAYCSAARPLEPHIWEAIPATHLFALRHSNLLRKYCDGVRDQGASPALTV